LKLGVEHGAASDDQGVRLPRALSPAFIRQALQASEGIPGLSATARPRIWFSRVTRWPTSF
jgi:hypothetical protein